VLEAGGRTWAHKRYRRGEAAFLVKLGDAASSEDQFHGDPNHMVSNVGGLHQIMDTGGKPENIVVRRGRGKRRNPLLIELKRPERWNNAGKEQLV